MARHWLMTLGNQDILPVSFCFAGWRALNFLSLYIYYPENGLPKQSPSLIIM